MNILKTFFSFISNCHILKSVRINTYLFFFNLIEIFQSIPSVKRIPYLTRNLLCAAEGGTHKVVRVSLEPWDKTLFTSEVQSDNAVADRKTSSFFEPC